MVQCFGRSKALKHWQTENFRKASLIKSSFPVSLIDNRFLFVLGWGFFFGGGGVFGFCFCLLLSFCFVWFFLFLVCLLFCFSLFVICLLVVFVLFCSVLFVCLIGFFSSFFFFCYCVSERILERPATFNWYSIRTRNALTF